jgi:TonB family protein
MGTTGPETSLMGAIRHKFEGIFFMHEVETGSHELAPVFLEKLRQNRPFAMDFWGLVDSLGRFHEKVSDQDLRNIVVNCVCGEGIPIPQNDPFFAEMEGEFRTHRAGAGQVYPSKADDSEDTTLTVSGNYPRATNYSQVMAGGENGPEELSIPEAGRKAIASEIPRDASSGLPVQLDMAQHEDLDRSLLATPASGDQPTQESSLAAGPNELADWPPLDRVETISAFPEILAASEERDRRRIDSAIAKLELNNVAMRLYLDSIDSRMSRLEPHVEELATQVVKSSWAPSIAGQSPQPLVDADSAALARHFAASGSAAPEEAEHIQMPSPVEESLDQRQTAAAEPKETLAEPATGDEMPSTEGSAPQRKRNQPSEFAVQALRSSVSTGMVVAALLVLVCGLLGIRVLHGGSTLENRTAAATGATAGSTGAPVTEAAAPSDPGKTVIASEIKGNGTSTSGATISGASSSSSSSGVSSSGSGASHARSNRDGVGDDGTAPPSTTWLDGSHSKEVTAMASTGNTLAGAHGTSAPATGSAGNGNNAAGSNSSNSGAGSSREVDEVDTDTSLPGNGSRQIQVSSGVMATNLIQSSPPEYPVLARLAHQQGPVVMQVFISNRGIVEHVNVVKGHRTLRGAAITAVRSWKYKPYYVNGRPVEVATMVTVDFKLGR